MIREILRMGDPRLLTRAAAVSDPQAPAIRELVADLFDTMRAADGAGLAAPQIGVPLRVVIFGYSDAAPPNLRYPLAELPPETILINPELTLLTTRQKKVGKAAYRCPACVAWCRERAACITVAITWTATSSSAS